MEKTRIEIKKENDTLKIFIYQDNELKEFYNEHINKKRLSTLVKKKMH